VTLAPALSQTIDAPVDVVAHAHPGRERGPQRLDLAIVIPAFNEEHRLPTGLGRLAAATERGAIDPTTTEIILVDDGSTDRTTERALALLAPFPHARVVRLPRNMGKGAAIRSGVAEVRSEVTVFMDSDMAVDPEHLPSLTSALDGADVAIGSRCLPASTVVCDSVRRTIMGRAFNRVVNATTRVGLGDTQCGFKAFRTTVARLLFHCTVSDRFAFDVDLLVLARRLGMVITQVPVSWRHVEGSRIRMLRDPLSMVGDVLFAQAGIRSRRPINGLVVTSTDPGRAVTPVVAAMAMNDHRFPLVKVFGDDSAFVLFPLLPEAEARQFGTQLAEQCPHATVAFRQIGLDSLIPSSTSERKGARPSTRCRFTLRSPISAV